VLSERALRIYTGSHFKVGTSNNLERVIFKENDPDKSRCI